MRAPDPDSLRLRLTLLGQPDAWSLTSERVLPRGRKARALLGVLAGLSAAGRWRSKGSGEPRHPSGGATGPTSMGRRR